MEELLDISKEEGLDTKFCWLYISKKKNYQEIPDSIPRKSREPLPTEVYFELHEQWCSLLAGRRTYLRPSKDNREKGDSENSNNVFRSPVSLLGCQEFEHLVNSIAKGMEDLYKRNLDNMSSRILSFPGLLTEIGICKREGFYQSLFPSSSSTDGKLPLSSAWRRCGPITVKLMDHKLWL